MQSVATLYVSNIGYFSLELILKLMKDYSSVCGKISYKN
jgi:hypothetical protein